MQPQVLRGAAAATLRGLCSGVWREGEATPSMDGAVVPWRGATLPFNIKNMDWVKMHGQSSAGLHGSTSPDAGRHGLKPAFTQRCRRTLSP